MSALWLLLAILFVAISCKEVEPEVDFCTPLSEPSFGCIPIDKSNPEYKVEYKKALTEGFICVSSKDFGELKKHHNELHERLNDCRQQ